MARGRVFVDIDGDKRFGDSDQPFVGVKVSNGKEIATTGEDGKYELPVQDGSIIFVIKPTGCLLYTSPSPRDRTRSRMPSSA